MHSTQPIDAEMFFVLKIQFNKLPIWKELRIELAFVLLIFLLLLLQMNDHMNRI